MNQEGRVTKGDVRRFVQRTRALYPFGVPRALLTQAIHPEHVHARPMRSEIYPLDGDSLVQAKVLFVLSCSLSSDARALLIAAVEKGLKLQCKEIAVVEHSSYTLTPENLPVLRAIVHCGTPRSTSPTSVPVFVSHAADEIACDAGKKKEFWATLKKVIPLVEPKES